MKRYRHFHSGQYSDEKDKAQMRKIGEFNLKGEHRLRGYVPVIEPSTFNTSYNPDINEFTYVVSMNFVYVGKKKMEDIKGYDPESKQFISN